MDVKLSTSTLTLNAVKQGQAKIDRRLATDKKTTSAELGYTVDGYCKKDVNSGETIETKYKLHCSKEEIPAVFRKVFESKMSSGKVDEKAVNMIKAELILLLAYFKDVNEHEIRGASLFIVVSPSNGQYKVKLIDLNSFRPLCEAEPGYVEGTTRDQGMILGVQNVIAMLDQICAE